MHITNAFTRFILEHTDCTKKAGGDFEEINHKDDPVLRRASRYVVENGCHNSRLRVAHMCNEIIDYVHGCFLDLANTHAGRRGGIPRYRLLSVGRGETVRHGTGNIPAHCHRT
jgi:hypothetical protein